MKFELHGEEEANADAFKSKHKHSRRYKHPSFSYIFHPTGLSNVVTIKCNLCGKTENITDYNTW